MTHLQTYGRLPETARRLLAELEELRREGAGGRQMPGVNGILGEVNVKLACHSADYVIRATTGDVLADDDVKLCMELALEEVGADG